MKLFRVCAWDILKRLCSFTRINRFPLLRSSAAGVILSAGCFCLRVDAAKCGGAKLESNDLFIFVGFFFF